MDAAMKPFVESAFDDAQIFFGSVAYGLCSISAETQRKPYDTCVRHTINLIASRQSS